MKSEKKTSAVRIAIMLLLVMVFFPLLPMIISGRWNWWEAWVMGALFVLSFIISRAIAAKKTPDILKERANYGTHANTQAWDKWLSPIMAFSSVFILLAAGLDELFNWSPDLSLGLELFGLALIVLGYVLGSYAFVENAFFSGTVRLQEERGHKVISSGPYGWVRHPGYLGSLIASLGMPLLLDSLWAFLPVIIFGFSLSCAPILKIAFFSKTCQATAIVQERFATVCFLGYGEDLANTGCPASIDCHSAPLAYLSRVPFACHSEQREESISPIKYPQSQILHYALDDNQTLISNTIKRVVRVFINSQIWLHSEPKGNFFEGTSQQLT